MTESKPVALEVFEMLEPSPDQRRLGMLFNLSIPYYCSNMQAASNLPFICKHLVDGRNELYFKYMEDLKVYAVIADPDHEDKDSNDIIIIALAKFVEPRDSDAVALYLVP